MKNNVTLRKPIENARLRDKNNVLLNVYSGERVAFVNKPAAPLPRRVKIGDTMAMIYHKDQLLKKPLCTNCLWRDTSRRVVLKKLLGKVGTKLGIILVLAKQKNHKNVTAFQGYKDPISNFFPVKDGIKVFCITAPTVEHAYQYSNAIQAGHDNIAKNIRSAKNAKIAKDEASFLPFNPNWASMKEKVMKQVLTAKAESCHDFRKNLLSMESSILAQAVHDDYFWSTGLDKELLLKTKKKNWPGENVMGKILTELRENLQQTKGNKRLTRSQEHVQHLGGFSDTDSEYDTS